MAASNVTFQIFSIKHDVTTLGEPIGASFDEIVQYLPITFATNVFTQISPIQGRQVEAESVNYNMSAELTIGAMGTLEIKLQEAGGTQATISSTNMLVGNIRRDFHSAPYTKRMTYINGAVPVVSATI